MSKWLQEKQMTAFEVTYQGKPRTLQDWAKGISIRDRARLGPEEKANFRDIVNVVSGLALGPRFAEVAPEYPTFSVLVTEENRKQLVANTLKALTGSPRTKDAIAILEALEMLDGDRIEPGHSRYAKEVLARLTAKGLGQVLNRSELLSGSGDAEYFAPTRFRLESDLFVAVLGSLVYSGDIVLAIAGDKIDSSKIGVLAERSSEDLKQFKHVEAPKEINVAVLRSLFELLGLSPGLAQMATQGSEEPVRQLLEAVTNLVNRTLLAGVDLKDKLAFWGMPLLSESEFGDYHIRLLSLKTFAEGLQPYNTVGKLKNLRVDSSDIEMQKQNLAVLKTVEHLLAFIADLGTLAAYVSQAELILPTEHPWLNEARTVRNQTLEKLATDRTAQNTSEYKQALTKLKKNYVTAYIGLHSKARLGVSEDKAKSALTKDNRLVAMRALAAVSLMPTSQLTGFEEKLGNLKSCASLVDSDLQTTATCPHCSFNPKNEQTSFLPASNALKQLDQELDTLLEAWQQSLIDNLSDPFIESNFELLRPAARQLVKAFLATKKLPDPVTPEFVTAVQDALSGLEKVGITADDIKTALLQGGSPATQEDLRKRFEAFLLDRSKGKDTSKLRFVVD
jgi:hypothetical protein